MTALGEACRPDDRPRGGMSPRWPPWGRHVAQMAAEDHESGQTDDMPHRGRPNTRHAPPAPAKHTTCPSGPGQMRDMPHRGRPNTRHAPPAPAKRATCPTGPAQVPSCRPVTRPAPSLRPGVWGWFLTPINACAPINACMFATTLPLPPVSPCIPPCPPRLRGEPQRCILDRPCLSERRAQARRPRAPQRPRPPPPSRRDQANRISSMQDSSPAWIDLPSATACGSRFAV